MATRAQPAVLAKPKALTLTSPAFAEGRPIPRTYSCKGEDHSPPLAWSDPPAGTRALALVVDDPDAPRGTWTHWTVWDLPPTVPSLLEGADVTKLGAVQGRTTAGTEGYHGPCPPSGTHRYYFRLFALERALELPSGAPVDDVWRALEGRVLAWGELMGTFTK